MTSPSPPPSPTAPARLQLLFGGVALLLGVLVLGSALLLPDWSRERALPVSHTGLNAALGFALGGLALLAPRWRTALAVLAGLALPALALAALCQPLHGWAAGSIGWQLLLNADPASGDPALWPGRMRLAVSAAFLLAGPAFLLLPWPGHRQRVAAVLGAAVATVALPSLFFNLMGNVLAGGENAAGLLLPVPSALGVMAVGLGLFFAAAPAGWDGLYAGREDRRIFVTSFALFSAMSLVASLVGIGIVGRYAMANFQQAWLTSFTSNTELFRIALAGSASRSIHLIHFIDSDALARRDQPALQHELERIARASHFDPDSSLAVYGPDGARLAAAGPQRYRGQFAIALPMPLAPRLYWQDGWHLLTELALPGGRRLRLDLALADFNHQFRRMAGDGSSREVRVCSRASATEMACFPSRLAALPMRLPLAGGAEPLPIQLALAGQSGVVTARDYRGKQVIAAFGMMPGTGLGLVQKIDTDEFYAPLRRQLWYALVGMTLLIVAGASMLYLRTHPLVLGLVRTRARLDAILNNVPAGVLTFDQHGTILSANCAAAEMFGYPRGALLGRRVSELLDGAQALLQPQLGRLHQLEGRRRDGAPLTLEVLANEFMLGKAKKRIAIVQDVGERLRMEQALRQREASLAHAQQLAHIGSWELDLASKTYFWSDETYRVFDMAPGAPAPAYDEVLRLLHPDDRELKRRAENDAIAGVREYDVKLRLLLPGGAVKVTHSRAETEFDAGGRALRMRGTIQDITEKTWADEQIRKREEEYRALVENSPDVVVRFDRALRCVYVNPALALAPGLAAVIGHGRVLGDTDASLMARPWVEAVRTAFEGSRAQPFEVVAGHCHYQVQVVPEFRQGGQVTAVLATARDITAIRSGEAVLRQSEERLAGIAANTPGAVFQCVSRGDDLVFTYVSGGVAQLFGEPPDAVLADAGRLLGHIAAADRGAFHGALARSGRGMRMLNWEGRASGADGREIWINCRASPRRAGEATIWEGLMLNITASKRNELELTESRQMLRELSAHRERVREEERKKIAREVHDELGQALTALRMDVALLRMADGPHSPALLARVASMKEAVDRTIGIVRNVTSALRPAALDLGLTAALEWQVEDFSRRSGIECMLHTGETEVVLDDDQATALFRIVQESLTNVLKHAHATHVEVTLETRDNCICLEVSDNGRGFAAGRPATRGRFGLVGMRERVLVLGGTVQVKSAAGAGTTVLVRLPLTIEQERRAPHDHE